MEKVSSFFSAPKKFKLVRYRTCTLLVNTIKPLKRYCIEILFASLKKKLGSTVENEHNISISTFSKVGYHTVQYGTLRFLSMADGAMDLRPIFQKINVFDDVPVDYLFSLSQASQLIYYMHIRKKV